jgi:hypothetical protein
MSTVVNNAPELRTLRPGLLVALTSSLKGNISYGTVEIEGKHIDVNGEERARWETTRVIIDPAEHELAWKVRIKARGLIKAVCVQSAFGLLCPEDRAEELIAAITEARRLVSEFNQAASVTRLSVNVIFGRIAQDDVEAVRAISAELRNLMEDMQEGLAELDVKKVRDAAGKAKQVGEMLSPSAQGRLEEAIAVARKSARQITKAGAEVAVEIDRAAIEAIDVARVSFLDIEEAATGFAPVIATPEMDARAVDLEVAGDFPVVSIVAPSMELEV